MIAPVSGRRPRHLDVLGATLITLGLTGITFAIVRTGTGGWSVPGCWRRWPDRACCDAGRVRARGGRRVITTGMAGSPAVWPAAIVESTQPADEHRAEEALAGRQP